MSILVNFVITRACSAACIAMSALLLALPATALDIGDRVGNFRLMDHNGSSHHLYYFSDKQAVVLLSQDNRCATSATAAQQMSSLADKYDGNVQFFMINSSLYDNRQSIRAAAAKLDVDTPILLDEAQLVGRTLQLSRAGEALVINPQGWKLTYRGDTGTTLDETLAALTQGKTAQPGSGQVAGCPIDYPDFDGTQVSYADTIAPILADNCVNCHREGGIGPWAMTDYNMIRGFAPMIREVLLTKRMPPWHADPEVGHWSNDRSMSTEELQAVISWIDAGSPRGTGLDPLQDALTANAAWGELGEPDLIIDIPPTDVPATGVVDYKYKYVKNPLDRDVWVRASQIRPGDRAVLHHVITRYGRIETEGRRKGRISRTGPTGGLAGYVPGAEARPLPTGTGSFLPADATIEFQMHYTTAGKATTDHSQIGIYFHEEPPEHQIRSMILANPRLKIPPHAKAHAETAMREFKKDAIIYSILPHAHYRGKAARLEAIYPDGSTETLLNVPNYDFNWQTSYLLQTPKFMPAGTRIVYTNWWDNSAQNPANPDPTREVPWGRQSWDEMIFGAISYRDAEEADGEHLAGSE